MAAWFLTNLPDNGGRGTRRKHNGDEDETENDCINHCQPYIAFHDTAPPNNVYSKVNPINHLERSCDLRKRMEKIKMQKKGQNNRKSKLQKKRLNRKRKRPYSNHDQVEPNKHKRKKIRTACDHKDVLDFLSKDLVISENNDNDTDNKSLFQSLNNLPKNK